MPGGTLQPRSALHGSVTDLKTLGSMLVPKADINRDRDGDEFAEAERYKQDMLVVDGWRKCHFFSCSFEYIREV